MKSSEANWLHDVVIYNESDEYAAPGDISVHRNVAEMCVGLEAWMVEGGGIGFALNGLGHRIDLEMEGDTAIGHVRRDEPDPDMVKIWLRHMALAILETRRHRAKKHWLWGTRDRLGPQEERGVLPETVEGLLAYIHLK